MQKKALIIILVFFLIILTLFIYGVEDNRAVLKFGVDNEAHLKMIKDPSYNTIYAPFLRTYLGVFGANYSYWTFLQVFIVCFLTPFLIYLITKNWLAPFFYFFITNYWWFILGLGLFSQGLLVVFALSLFVTKNNYIRGGLMFIGSLVHSTAIYLLPLIFLFLLVEEQFFQKKLLVLGCSPIFGNNTPGSLQTNVSAALVGPWALTIKDLLSFLTKMLPIFFLVPALYALYKRREVSYLLLFVLCLVFGFCLNSRVLVFFAPFMVIGFVRFYEKTKLKRLWFFVTCLYGAFEYFNIWLTIAAFGC